MVPRYFTIETTDYSYSTVYMAYSGILLIEVQTYTCPQAQLCR